MAEFNFNGVYVPVLLVYAVLAYALLLLIRKCLRRLVDESWWSAPGLVFLSLYGLLFWLLHFLHTQFS